MQRDLFKDFQVEEEKKKIEPLPPQETRPSLFERVGIHLTLDQLILWVLINITSFVFIYSLGVEQGMKLLKRGSSIDQSERVLLTAGEETPTTFQNTRTDELPVAVEADHQVVPDQESVPELVKVQPTTLIPVAEQNRKGRSFTIQLVTYRSETQAKREIEKLTQKGHEAFVIPSGKFFQVCVDRFEGKDQAFRKLLVLRTEGYHQIYHGAYVRPVNK